MKKTLVSILATLTALASSQAALVVFNAQNIPIPTTFAGVYLDVETGAAGGVPTATADVNFFFGGAGISNDATDDVSVTATPTLQFVRTGTGILDAAVNSGVGTVVGAGGPYATGFGGSGDPNVHLGVGAGLFEVGETGYLGFSLESGAMTLYGFFEVMLTENDPGGIIKGWAYEDSGADITTFVIPEPSAALLSLLGIGLLARRRR